MCSQWLPMGTDSFTPLPPPPAQPFLPAVCKALAIVGTSPPQKSPTVQYIPDLRRKDGKNYTYPPQWIHLGMLLPLQAAQEVGGGV